MLAPSMSLWFLNMMSIGTKKNRFLKGTVFPENSLLNTEKKRFPRGHVTLGCKKTTNLLAIDKTT